jgi:DeoR family fructose operon transcriptional repressor
MFHDEKLEKIQEMLELQPYWKSIDLARKLGISKSTVQRCLQELDDQGVARRIHGGIRHKDTMPLSPVSLGDRIARDVAAKVRIAEVAMGLVPDRGYVYFDAGTTTLPLVHAWLRGGGKKCTVVTNDVAIAVVLAKHQIEHILLTGKIHPVTQSLSGTASQIQLLDFHFKACFISADGIDAAGKIACAITDEAMLKRLVAKNSDTRILLAASSKWNMRSNILIARLDTFDIWVTEKSNRQMKSLCQARSVKLMTPKR